MSQGSLNKTKMSIAIYDENRLLVKTVEGELDNWTFRDLNNWYPRMMYSWVFTD